jgi:septum formation protein
MVESLILASGSPRRRDILQQLGVPFVVLPSAVDEQIEPHWTPVEVATTLVWRRRAISCSAPTRSS